MDIPTKQRSRYNAFAIYMAQSAAQKLKRVGCYFSKNTLNSSRYLVRNTPNPAYQARFSTQVPVLPPCFSSTRTPSMTMLLSTALHMS